MRKHYLVDEECRGPGGIYIRETKKAAEDFCSPEWRQFIRERYGCDPEVRYFLSPVTVDNTRGAIETGDPATPPGHRPAAPPGRGRARPPQSPMS